MADLLQFLTNAPMWVQISGASVSVSVLLVLITRLVATALNGGKKKDPEEEASIGTSLAVIAEQTKQMNVHLVEIKDAARSGFEQTRSRLELLQQNLGLAMQRQVTRDDLPTLKQSKRRSKR